MTTKPRKTKKTDAEVLFQECVLDVHGAHDPAQTMREPDTISVPLDPAADFQEDAPKPEEEAPKLSKSVIRPERKKAYEDGTCGDEVAAMLRGKTLDDLKVLAAEWSIGWAWGHLNPGMQRMNFGNKLRTAIKKRAAELVAPGEDVKDVEAFLTEAAGDETLD